MKIDTFNRRILKRFRIVHNESQVDLANALKLSEQTIIRLEQGRNKPSKKTLQKLCTHYNVVADVFFTQMLNLRIRFSITSHTLDCLLIFKINSQQIFSNRCLQATIRNVGMPCMLLIGS